MNKFEQVSSDGHQISLAGRPELGGVPCLVSGGPYSEVQSTMINGHMGTPSPCEQTNLIQNITFPQLGWRSVKISFATPQEKPTKDFRGEEQL